MLAYNPNLEILVSNDDGITANGILSLIEVAREFGNVTVVAPDSPQSGMGHAISVGKPLRIEEVNLSNGMIGYACSGTPADCVKLATGVIMKHKPDLVLSGINHGSNASVAVFYSGTMSAAVEGVIEGIPSVGFSLDDFGHHADFTAAKIIARQIINHLLQQKLPPYVTLNVNIPKLPIEKIKGIRCTRQSIGRWIEQFDARVDPYGRDYYWLTGKFYSEDTAPDTDIYALAQGYVSVCPVHIDITSHSALQMISNWKFELNP